MQNNTQKRLCYPGEGVGDLKLGIKLWNLFQFVAKYFFESLLEDLNYSIFQPQFRSSLTILMDESPK